MTSRLVVLQPGWLSVFLAGADDAARTANALKSLGSGANAPAETSPAPPLLLADALDSPELSWRTGGDAPWTAQADETATNGMAARSGTLAEGQVSWLETTVTGWGNIEFQWRVSAHGSGGRLEFWVDGKRMRWIARGTEWFAERFFFNDEGLHVVRWQYVMTTNTTLGQGGWLDDVRFDPFVDPVQIVAHPQSQTVALGAPATFCVNVSGAMPIEFQWYRDGVLIAGATQACYRLPACTLADSGSRFQCTVRNPYSSGTSLEAVLTVIELESFTDDFEPDIQLPQWTAFGGVVGESVLATNYGGAVSGQHALWFGADGERYAATRPLDTTAGGVVSFWLRLGDAVEEPWDAPELPEEGIVLEYSIDEGAHWVELGRYNTGRYRDWTYEIADIPAPAQTPRTQFRWRQLHHTGEHWDHWALDDVEVRTGAQPPWIVAHPQDQTIVAGLACTLCVTAGGSPPLSFQWWKDGAAIAGATQACYTLPHVQPSDSGSRFRCEIRNAYGSITSTEAQLTVLSSPRLEIRRDPDGLAVRWTDKLQVFDLEAADKLGSQADWYDVASADLLEADGTNKLRLQAGQSEQYFRLTAFQPLPDPSPTMVWIPAGEFTMGDALDEGDPDERPVHVVWVDGFFMDRHEITEALWQKVYQWGLMHGYEFEPVRLSANPDSPARAVTWYDAVKWCNARSEMEQRVPAYYTDPEQSTVYRKGRVDVRNDWVKWTADGYRLPTEAEWEKAARGGLAAQRFPWGDRISHRRANYFSDPSFDYEAEHDAAFQPDVDGLWPFASPVGSHQPNPFGLFDMAGNVREWCWDWYDDAWYASPAARQANVVGPATGTHRVVRGGSWLTDTEFTRCACRQLLLPDSSNTDIGFRCVRR